MTSQDLACVCGCDDCVCVALVARVPERCVSQSKKRIYSEPRPQRAGSAACRVTQAYALSPGLRGTLNMTRRSNLKRLKSASPDSALLKM